ncbi:MAG: hypothetical protein IJM44_00485 [Ruminococcus sp.]|nr:hypothetical protein [Ruminococcus sp.]
MSIRLTDEIRGSHFTSPLDPGELKYYTENFALAVLRYCFDCYDDLTVCDAPDLQSADNSVGIEVTEVAISMNRAIVGDCLHYWETGDVKYKNKAEQRGATAGEMYYVLPSVDSEDELAALETIFRKKLGKLSSYKKRGFRRLGLIMIMDGLPLKNTAMSWADVVREIQSSSRERYDVVYFAYSAALSYYDCETGDVGYIQIEKPDLEALKKYARLAVEKGREQNVKMP